MERLFKIYSSLRKRENASQGDIKALESLKIKSVQKASLLAGLSCSKKYGEENQLFSSLAGELPHVAHLLKFRYPQAFSGSMPRHQKLESPEYLKHVFNNIGEKRTIGKHLLKMFIDDFCSKRIDAEIVAAWLMLVCVEGMSASDLVLLTKVMVESGRVYDYRNDARLKSCRLISRYPTGALSEKAALILPSIISATRNDVPVATPFLVARSLGFTGGTWDKLNSIPGFQFPYPGDMTIESLVKCGIAMVVAQGDVNPADRLMYQLRSVTGTVESIHLIISSIASKQIALPVHRLLLDVRFGQGSFLSSQEAGVNLGNDLVELLIQNGIPSNFLLTETKQPNGSAIGNALEVAESVAILSQKNYELWDESALSEQEAIILNLFGKIMSLEFPINGFQKWKKIGRELLANGEALKSFCKMLTVHGVKNYIVEQLINNPFETLGISSAFYEIRSRKCGILRSINQKSLGAFVNMELLAGGNDYFGQLNTKNGIILCARLGDSICVGQVLCKVYSEFKMKPDQIQRLESYFIVSN